LVAYLAEKKLKRESWMEKKPYPGSSLQPIFSAVLLVLSLVIFAFFANGGFVIQTLLLVVLASLTFSVAIFPQYIEFSGMAGALVREGSAKARVGKGIRRFVPLLSLLVVLTVAPVLILVAAPGFFMGSLMGIVVGFSGFQFAFTLYVRGWERAHGLRLSRYSLVSEDERGKRVVLEYGLRAERT
jgi:archaellum biogenesis protein FlaJ (TadC family)